METQREEVLLHFLCISVVHLKVPTFRLTTALQRCKLLARSGVEWFGRLARSSLTSPSVHELCLAGFSPARLQTFSPPTLYIISHHHPSRQGECAGKFVKSLSGCEPIDIVM